MKTAGRITTTLTLLISLYILGYWFLIKKKWAYTHLTNPAKPYHSPMMYRAICDAFNPIGQLDVFWNREIPTRKHLTGHWRSEKAGDFVILGPNQECHFKLGEFAFEGKVKFDALGHSYKMVFPHQKRSHKFILFCNATGSPPDGKPTAQARVRGAPDDPFHNEQDTEFTLTKHFPNSATPSAPP